MPTLKTERVLVREALERYYRADPAGNNCAAAADAEFGANTAAPAKTPTAAGGTAGATTTTMPTTTTTTTMTTTAAAANAKGGSRARGGVGKSARSSAPLGIIPTTTMGDNTIVLGAGPASGENSAGAGRTSQVGSGRASSGRAGSKAAPVRRTELAAAEAQLSSLLLPQALLLRRDPAIGTAAGDHRNANSNSNSNSNNGSGGEDYGGVYGYGYGRDYDLGGGYDAGGGYGGGGGGGGTAEPPSFWRSPGFSANDSYGGGGSVGTPLGTIRAAGQTKETTEEVQPAPSTSASASATANKIPSKVRYAMRKAAAATATRGRGGVARTKTKIKIRTAAATAAATTASGNGPRLISPVPGLPTAKRGRETTRSDETHEGGAIGASTNFNDADLKADRGRVAALIAALERDGHLRPLPVGPADADSGGTGKGGDGGIIFGSLANDTAGATPKAAAGATAGATPSGGRGLACVSLASSSTSASPFSGRSSAAGGGGADYASPPAPGTYRHLLLDRFLPPLGADSAPATNGTSPTATAATTAATGTGTWPADAAVATDPHAAGSAMAAATAPKRGRGGRRGRRTKQVARKRPGRGSSGGATKKKDDGDDDDDVDVDVDDPRPPSLDAYLAGLAEAKLQRAQIRRRALEREEAAYSLTEGDEGGDDDDMEKGGDGATATAGWGYPTTLATDADEDHLAPKHVFGRKYLYELVCDPTTTTGTAKKVSAGKPTKGKAATGPAKKKRRRVFTVAPKSSSTSGATKTVTSTTIREDAADHRVRIRCRHCRDDADCLRPSSLGDSHFYNLLCGWAANHYGRCEAAPPALQARYGEAKAVKTRGRKAHWIEAAHSIGLRNIVDKDGRLGHGVAFAPSAARASESE